jgi:hypothetical protein
VVGVGAVGPGAALGAAQLGRLGQVRGDPGPPEFFDHVAPAGAALQREGHLLLVGEAFQPGAQLQAVGEDDPAGGHLPGVLVQ